MAVAIDEVVGEVEPEAETRTSEAPKPEMKSQELEQLRAETRRLERREARLRAN